jgi:hypothetical protein
MPGPSKTEPRYGLHYPALGDTPDAEADGKKLVEDIAEINMGRGAVLQPGIVEPTDYTMTAAISGSTGEISPASTISGQVWLTDPSVAYDLMWHFSVGLTFKIKPPSLPANGKYMSCLVVLTPSKWRGDPTFSILSGTEQANLNAAENHPPAVASPKMAIREVVIKNNAGTYEIAKDKDRRPWARGALWNVLVPGEETSTSTTYREVPSATARLELTGVPIRVSLYSVLVNGTANQESGQVTIQGPTVQSIAANVLKTGVGGLGNLLMFEVVETPTAGSYLFKVEFKSNTAGKTTGLVNTNFVVQEILHPVANNGVS